MSSCLRAVRDAVFGWAEAAGETARAGDPVATTAAAVNAMRPVSLIHVQR